MVQGVRLGLRVEVTQLECGWLHLSLPFCGWLHLSLPFGVISLLIVWWILSIVHSIIPGMLNVTRKLYSEIIEDIACECVLLAPPPSRDHLHTQWWQSSSPRSMGLPWGVCSTAAEDFTYRWHRRGEGPRREGVESAIYSSRTCSLKWCATKTAWASRLLTSWDWMVRTHTQSCDSHVIISLYTARANDALAAVYQMSYMYVRAIIFIVSIFDYSIAC